MFTVVMLVTILVSILVVGGVCYVLVNRLLPVAANPILIGLSAVLAFVSLGSCFTLYEVRKRSSEYELKITELTARDASSKQEIAEAKRFNTELTDEVEKLKQKEAAAATIISSYMTDATKLTNQNLQLSKKLADFDEAAAVKESKGTVSGTDCGETDTETLNKVDAVLTEQIEAK